MAVFDDELSLKSLLAYGPARRLLQALDIPSIAFTQYGLSPNLYVNRCHFAISVIAYNIC